MIYMLTTTDRQRWRWTKYIYAMPSLYKLLCPFCGYVYTRGTSLWISMHINSNVILLNASKCLPIWFKLSSTKSQFAIIISCTLINKRNLIEISRVTLNTLQAIVKESSLLDCEWLIWFSFKSMNYTSSWKSMASFINFTQQQCSQF